ncbi:hypothetical protein [Paenibacillus tyrfis]|uniref:hypothetical protein n=1 Tax=Paenibacillus tyrfis TaxID=1501230 RepID=UPI00209C9B68|nr:hypothetical protein [Paenibacillus tyrfis]MCP1312591.1 hypothetical protein [Paenibacillus tyrfis]
MSETSLVIKNDILIIAYYLKEYGWREVNKSTFQRLLYFSAVLSPIFMPKEEWAYNFANTLFGPYNNELSVEINDLETKGFLVLEERKIYSNRVEDRFTISQYGIDIFEKRLLSIDTLKSKISWFNVLVRTLSLYGEEFLSKLVKEDPNIYYQNEMNRRSRLITDDSSDNLSKEFFEFIKEKGIGEDINLANNQDYLLLFFDVLYQKYKGGKEN